MFYVVFEYPGRRCILTVLLSILHCKATPPLHANLKVIVCYYSINMSSSIVRKNYTVDLSDPSLNADGPLTPAMESQTATRL